MRCEHEMRVARKHDSPLAGEATRPGRQYLPPVDIYETAEAVVVEADMPGVRREGVRVLLEDGILTIEGDMVAADNQGRRILLREFEPGHYLRRFTISEDIDQDNIRACLTDGVLQLTLPKAGRARARRIEVTAG